MPRLVLADSNFFISFFLANNSLHQRCHQLVKKHQAEKFKPCVTNYVMAEVLAVMRRLKAQPDLIKKTISIFQNKLVMLDSLPARDERTLEIFMADKTQKLSFTDADLIATMQQERIKNLVTFDEHLAEAATERDFMVLK